MKLAKLNSEMVSRTRGKYFKQGYISEPFCFDIFGSIYLDIKLHSNFVGYHFNHLHFGDLRSDFSYLWILLSATKTVLGGSPTKHPPCCTIIDQIEPLKNNKSN